MIKAIIIEEKPFARGRASRGYIRKTPPATTCGHGPSAVRAARRERLRAPIRFAAGERKPRRRATALTALEPPPNAYRRLRRRGRPDTFARAGA